MFSQVRSLSRSTLTTRFTPRMPRAWRLSKTTAYRYRPRASRRRSLGCNAFPYGVAGV